MGGYGAHRAAVFERTPSAISDIWELHGFCGRIVIPV